MEKRAIIVGHKGQDGTLLTQSLIADGYEIVGIGRDSKATTSSDVTTLVRSFRPQEIYYLAAYHHSAHEMLPDAGDLFSRSWSTHVLSFVNYLEAARTLSDVRLFYAASSHVFGDAKETPQSEVSAFNPVDVYGITKLAGLFTGRYYRDHHGIFVSVGILYNHESPLRASRFLSKRIVEHAVAIRLGKKNELVLGDLEATVDWGHAGDYVEAMRAILAAPNPGEFVIASGQAHSVRDFARIAFEAVGLDWKKYVREDSSLIKKRQKGLVGDNRKLRSVTGWEPKTSFETLVQNMVKAEMGKYDRPS